MSATLEDSTTYQWILQKGIARGRTLGEAVGEALGEARGRAAEARELIARLGSKRFGELDASQAARLTANTDLPRLQRIIDRLLEAAGWDDLLGTP